MFHLYEKIKQNQVYIIAEMSANHGGNIENALEIVQKAAQAGADCVKIQTYTADSMTIDCDNDYFKIKNGLWEGYKLYDLYQDAKTPYGWQKRIKEECEKCGVDFLSTPFDSHAVDFLEEIGAEAYKIASFELVDIPLIEYTASKGKPVIISTGMGSIEEIQDAVDACRRAGNHQIILLKCCSEYPAGWADMHVGNIPDMKRRFHVPVGLSDHSAGSLGAVAGAVLGACIVEKHVKLDGVESADSAFSMTMEEFGRMVKDVHYAKLTAQGPEYALTKGEAESAVFRRSIFAVKDIACGEEFTEENLRIIRPGYGIAPKYLKKLSGKKSTRVICRGEPLQQTDLEEAMAGSPIEKDHQPCFLRLADMDDMDLLYQWANDDLVRKNAFHTERISMEEHKKWFLNLLRDTDQKQFIMMREKEAIGQIRVSVEGTDAVIHYSIDSEKRGMGYGSEIISLAVREIQTKMPFVKRITGKVKNGNDLSAMCFKSNHFSLVFSQFEYKV